MTSGLCANPSQLPCQVCRRSEAYLLGPLRYGKGMPRISSKHQVTLPVETLKRAGLNIGDEVAIEAEGTDRIVVRRVARDVERAFGIFDGLYEPDYLERLRADERA
jgi:bifunctional DNA-binding transcriptional regulator/antitoxin component of YhaV-PrlF toxin-antitoxin module